MFLVTCVSLFLVVTYTGGQPVNNTTQECGVSNHVTPGGLPEHPWVVGVQYENLKGFPCLGTLIAPNLVLTAAQCVHGIRKMKSVKLDNCATSPCEYEVKRKISHPAFSPLRPELDNDVAILVLKDNVPADQSYICLPEGTYSPSTLVGKRTFVVGNNIDKTGHRHLELRENLNVSMVPMPVMSIEDCQKIYKATSIVLHSSHLCAASPHVETCHGDSAEPLVEHAVNNRWVLRAIASFGPSLCSDTKEPMIYTNVGAHLEWIKETRDSL